MGTFRLQRLFTVYDDTDNLKRLKDSDILAERRRDNPGIGGVIASSLVGAAGGAAAGGAIGGGIGAFISGKGDRMAGAMKHGKTGALVGAGLGALSMGASAFRKRQKKVDENNFYNERLEYAQRNAKRRERQDWKRNMSTRDGYSF